MLEALESELEALKSAAQALGYEQDPLLNGFVAQCVRFHVPREEVGDNWTLDDLHRYAYSSKVVGRTRAALVSRGYLEVDPRPLAALRVDDKEGVSKIFEEAISHLLLGQDVDWVREVVGAAVHRIRYAAMVFDIRRECVAGVEVVMQEAYVPETGCNMAAYPYGLPKKYGIQINDLSNPK